MSELYFPMLTVIISIHFSLTAGFSPPGNTVQEMLSSFWSKYPEFVEHVFQGLVLSPQHIEYASSSLQDRDDLEAILRGLEVRLDQIEILFPKWETKRRDTIAHLNIYAMEIDEVRRCTNYGKLGGSSVSLGGGGLVHAGIAGVAGPGALIGGAIVTLGSHVMYTQVEKGLIEKITELAREDACLTSELDGELRYLSEYVGQLGRWIQVFLPQPSISTAIRANLESMGIGVGVLPGALGGVAFSMAPAQSVGKDAAKKILPGESLDNPTKGAEGLLADNPVGVTEKALSTTPVMMNLNLVGMAVNAGTIAYVAHDLWTGSKSATAAHLRELASTLENELGQARIIYRKLQKEGERQQLQRRAEAAEAAAGAAEQRIRDLEAQLALQGR